MDQDQDQYQYQYDTSYDEEEQRRRMEDQLEPLDRGTGEAVELRPDEQLQYDENNERNTARGARMKGKDEALVAYSDLLAKQMSQEKVKEALRMNEPALLKQAIDEYKDHDLDPEDPLIIQAELKHRQIVTCRQLLTSARRAKDAQQLEDALKRTMLYKLEPFLKDDVTRARQTLERLTLPEPKGSILAMDKKTMTEIRSYAKPSPLVHRIMTAAMLLLGEDEGTTAVWAKVQKLCYPDGEAGMVRRMTRFDPNAVDPWIKERVRFLLKGIELALTQKTSPGCATFFVWAKSVIGSDPEEEEKEEERGRRHDEDGDTVYDDGMSEYGATSADKKEAWDEMPPEDPKVVQKHIQHELKIFAAQREVLAKAKRGPRPIRAQPPKGGAPKGAEAKRGQQQQNQGAQLHYL